MQTPRAGLAATQRPVRSIWQPDGQLGGGAGACRGRRLEGEPPPYFVITSGALGRLPDHRPPPTLLPPLFSSLSTCKDAGIRRAALSACS